MNAEAIALGRSLVFGGGGGACVRYGTVKAVGEGRATVDVDGGTVEAPAMTCVPTDADGKRAVVLVDGQSATVLGVLGEGQPQGGGGSTWEGPHIVETGTSGLWTYRIWSDGEAECWKSFDADGKAFDAAYGNCWFLSYVSDLPLAFESTPYAWATVRTESGGITGVSFNGDCSPTTLGFYVYSMKHEASLDIRIQLYARGRVAQ